MIRQLSVFCLLYTSGPGDFFGVRQSGMVEFAVGDIFTDADILKEASRAADKLLKEDKMLCREENQGFRRYMEQYIKEGLDRLNL